MKKREREREREMKRERAYPSTILLFSVIKFI